MDERRRRLLPVVVVVVVAMLVAAVWGYAFRRQSVTVSAYSAPVGALPSPSLSPTPTPTPIATPPPSATPSPVLAALAVPAVKGRPLRVALLGDSLAGGAFASSFMKTMPVDLLATLRTRYPVSSRLARLSGLKLTAAQTPKGSDLVVLTVGTDSARTMSASAFGPAYASLVKAVRAASPTAALVCAGLWSSGGSAYDAAISQACAAARGYFVSLACLYSVPDTHGPAGLRRYGGISDAVAPNDTGQAAIAYAITAAVRLAPPVAPSLSTAGRAAAGPACAGVLTPFPAPVARVTKR